jgi:hypothetical protein
MEDTPTVAAPAPPPAAETTLTQRDVDAILALTQDMDAPDAHETRNDYFSREATLRLAPVPNRVVVIGCGGCGSWAALLWAVQGTRTIILVDDDTVDVSNLNRQMLRSNDNGLLKTQSIRSLLESVRRVSVITHDIRFDENATFLEGYDTDDTVVFVCTDNDKSRRLADKVFRTARVIHLSAEGDIAFWAIEHYSDTVISTSLDKPERETYQVVPQWLGPNLLSAIAGVLRVRRPECTLTLNVKDVK